MFFCIQLCWIIVTYILMIFSFILKDAANQTSALFVSYGKSGRVLPPSLLFFITIQQALNKWFVSGALQMYIWCSRTSVDNVALKLVKWLLRSDSYRASLLKGAGIKVELCSWKIKCLQEQRTISGEQNNWPAPVSMKTWAKTKPWPSG